MIALAKLSIGDSALLLYLSVSKAGAETLL